MILCNINFNFQFSDLYEHAGLVKIDHHFLSFLKNHDEVLYEALLLYRANPPAIFPSDFILKLAPIVEDYLAQLFNISASVLKIQSAYNAYAPIMHVKRNFVQRWAIKKYPNPNDDDPIHLSFIFADELTFARQITEWLGNEDAHQDELNQAAQYAAWATLTQTGQKKHKTGILFKKPKPQSFDQLIENLKQNQSGAISLDAEFLRTRNGFKLTDHGFNRDKAFDQAHYCIWCHHQGKDSCSKGMPPKKDSSDRFAKNPLGQDLTGCPLEQKISEMNELVSQGYILGALGVICIDNPLVAATGHRICNECVKACIFQKQDPVQIPATETKVLQDVLDLPWGFEIYSLLTRWNPLNIHNPLPKTLTNKTVLVVGMGPAGFTLAHYLLNEGHTVIGIDALKIEPLDNAIEPIENIEDFYESLDDRITWGFGGVTEYGITVRWNKNFLKIIRLLLQRRNHFAVFGGVRFGGTLTIDQAFELGIDHVALCMGAGSPTTLNLKNSLATGVRQASDFLMALQLGGAGKENSLANLQIRMPVVVIGGGLTAVDTATEAMAYYPVQVTKFLKRFEHLVRIHGEDNIWQIWNELERKIAQEFLDHAKLFEGERQLAFQEAREPNFQKIMNDLGGVRIVYRKSIQESPSYRGSHEELAKAFEEGIGFIDSAVPLEFSMDASGCVEGLYIQQKDQKVFLSAKSVLIAAGTKPNVSLNYDTPNQIKLMQCEGKRVFQTIDEDNSFIQPEISCKPIHCDILTRLDQDGRAVTFFGDQHPSFEGNVVKAMASAKQGYPAITKLLKNVSNKNSIPPREIIKTWQELLRAYIVDVQSLTHKVVEITIKAPLAARAFRPGQFFRLQNFESNVQKMAMTEGIALTGVSVDCDAGTISTIVVERGASTSLCQKLKQGDQVILMGPTGSPTYIPKDETVLLVGEDIGNAGLLSIAKAMRANGCKIVYLASYKSVHDCFKIEEIRQVADHVIWCFRDNDQQDFPVDHDKEALIHGDIERALMIYGETIEHFSIKISDIERMFVMSSNETLVAIEKIHQTKLKQQLHPNHVAIVSINSSMQCMMKEVCGQCLQLYKDPNSGEERIIFNCVNREHSMSAIDLDTLSRRLRQNSVHEKLTALWAKIPLNDGYKKS